MMRGYYFDMGWMYKPLCVITEDISEAMKKASELFPEMDNLNPIPVICSKIFLPYCLSLSYLLGWCLLSFLDKAMCGYYLFNLRFKVT